jgi:hypothetical protein
MSRKKDVRKGATAVKDRAEEAVQKLGDALPTKAARKANKKLAKSMRKHRTGWGAAVSGLVAVAIGAVIGLAAARRTKR